MCSYCIRDPFFLDSTKKQAFPHMNKQRWVSTRASVHPVTQPGLKEQTGRLFIKSHTEKQAGLQRRCMQRGHVLEWCCAKKLKYVSRALAVFRPSLSRHSPHTTDGSSLKGAGLSLGGFTKNDLRSLLYRLFLWAVCVTLEPDLLRELCKWGNSANAVAKNIHSSLSCCEC